MDIEEASKLLLLISRIESVLELTVVSFLLEVSGAPTHEGRGLGSDTPALILESPFRTAPLP